MPEEKTLRTTDSRIDFVTPEEIKAFLAERDGTCLSLFQPTYRGAESEQNPIHLKNLLKEAASKLEECGVRKPEIDDLLSPLKSLLNREDFWRHQLDGLALFRSKDFFAYYRLPFELEDKVVLNDRFYIRPLLPALAEGHFYILALSQDQARLFKATRHGVVEIDLTGLGVPLSLAEALRYD
ncbi:MAG TPA: hypothetical protein VE975_02200, partial [Actinomycetota bacterium]|nr:hypothetical protein [Actinomycetota bacterium]